MLLDVFLLPRGLNIIAEEEAELTDIAFRSDAEDKRMIKEYERVKGYVNTLDRRIRSNKQAILPLKWTF